MGSSKYFKSRTYQERAQPESRSNLGLLEKKKDYLQRAKDAKNKKKQLDRLHERAFMKNRDEFHFAMITQSKLKDKKNDIENLTTEESSLTNTQNSNYINSKMTSERKKIQRLEQDSRDIFSNGWTPVNKHKVFVDTKNDVESFRPADYFETIPEAVGRTYNRPKLNQLLHSDLIINNSSSPESLRKEFIAERRKMRVELSARKDRLNKIEGVRQVLQYRKNIQDKSERELISNGRNKIHDKDPLQDTDDEEDFSSNIDFDQLGDNDDLKKKIPVYKWKRIRKS